MLVLFKYFDRGLSGYDKQNCILKRRDIGKNASAKVKFKVS